AATLPSNGRDGLFNLAQGWRLHPGYTPWHDLRDLLWYVSALCVVVLAVILIRRHDDHGLLFGYLTVLAVLSAAAMFLSFLARESLEDQAAFMFAILAGLGVLALVLTAYDWARRQFMIAAAVVAAGLSIFIVRVGFESLKVPPQWDRNQIAARAL